MSEDYIPEHSAPPVEGEVIDMPPPVIPAQIAFPARAVLRTILQWLLGALIAWMARVWGLDLAPYSSEIIDGATAAIAVLATAFFAWLMTRPKIARLLAGTPLSPVPSK